jgi:glucokinase
MAAHAATRSFNFCQMDLIADIGGTNSRLALLDRDGRIAHAASFRNQDFSALEDVLARFLASSGAGAPERAVLAIAAPVAGDEIAMTNIGWRFRRDELRRAAGARELRVLNDFEALAHALPRLRAGDVRQVGGGRAISGATLAVIGPGSGLGVATAAPHGEGWTAVGGEGGHVSLPALSPDEAAIIADHGEPNGHCSAERLVSGPGLVRIHATLARLAGEPPAPLMPRDITDRALRGDVIAAKSFDVFCGWLGTLAGNLALIVGARGGVFVAGGIVPRMIDAFARSPFRERFVAKGNYRGYLDAIPTSVILAENPAFIGLRATLGFR